MMERACSCVALVNPRKRILIVLLSHKINGSDHDDAIYHAESASLRCYRYTSPRRALNEQRENRAARECARECV